MIFRRTLVTIGITLFFSLPAFSSEVTKPLEVLNEFIGTTPSRTVILDHPYYLNDLLDIPIVDTPDQAGLFQDGLFQYDPQIDAWKLLKVNKHEIRKGIITKVETIITDTFPVQVFLKISSPDIACNTPGRINKKFDDFSNFNIIVDFIPPPPDSACIAALVPYEKIIPLDVYGLSTGIYRYTINGDEHSGTFELTADNKF